MMGRRAGTCPEVKPWARSSSGIVGWQRDLDKAAMGLMLLGILYPFFLIWS